MAPALTQMCILLNQGTIVKVHSWPGKQYSWTLTFSGLSTTIHCHLQETEFAPEKTNYFYCILFITNIFHLP